MQIVKKQKGFSALQIVIGLALIGAMLTCVLRILPLYMDNWIVQDGLKALGESSELASMEREEITKRLRSGFDLNGVRGKPSKSIKVIRRSEGWLVNIDYEERVEIFGNMDVIVSFENQLNAAKPNLCCKKIIADVAE